MRYFPILFTQSSKHFFVVADQSFCSPHLFLLFWKVPRFLFVRVVDCRMRRGSRGPEDGVPGHHLWQTGCPACGSYNRLDFRTHPPPFPISFSPSPSILSLSHPHKLSEFSLIITRQQVTLHLAARILPSEVWIPVWGSIGRWYKIKASPQKFPEKFAFPPHQFNWQSTPRPTTSHTNDASKEDKYCIVPGSFIIIFFWRSLSSICFSSRMPELGRQSNQTTLQFFSFFGSILIWFQIARTRESAKKIREMCIYISGALFVWGGFHTQVFLELY